ncbi:MAG TPA: hypothetical protein VI409_13920 [Gaiellaceae bacterium]|nr:hypothetical protein [Gaiellaceae bacterium]
MIVTTDFRLVLDEAAISTVLPAGLDRPGLQRRLATVLEDLETVAAPTACYDAYPIERILHERLELASGTRIGCGQLASVIAGAEELYVAVCTLGGGLDERIRTYRAENRYVEMLLLDELGTWAVDHVRTQLYERVQAELGDRGWHLSSPLSPGESAWPIREQRIIFRLLDTAKIDVTLGASDLMRPLKSLTLAFGAGAQELGTEGLSRCHFCSIRDRCRYAA